MEPDGSKLGELQGLPADSAPQIEDLGGSWKVTAEAKGPGSAGAIAGPLPGQAFVELEEDLPEAGAGLVHAICSSCR